MIFLLLEQGLEQRRLENGAENGEKQLATFPYGWMKSSFKEGQQVSIAWENENPETVLPLEGSWFLQKGLVYLGFVVVLWIVFGMCMECLY